MSQLNQIVAALLRDINQAKSQADFETRELVNLYAADDILKYFTVPRIGIQNLDVELKYAVESVEEQPFQSAQAQERLAGLLRNFAVETAKALQSDVAKTVLGNPMYKSLREVYPGADWQKSIADTISDELVPAAGNPANLSLAISGVEKKLTAQIALLVPTAKKVGVFSVVPTNRGAFQILSFDDKGDTDLEIGELYEDETTALNDTRLLADTVKRGQLVTSGFTRNEERKVEMASIKLANKTLTLLLPALAAVTNKELFFRDRINSKTRLINNPIVRQPWLTGRIPVSTNPGRPATTTFTEETDESLRKAATDILRQRFLQLQSTVGKLAAETKTTSLKILVEAEKLKAVKPENLLTLKFSLNAQDFQVFDNDQQTTLL